MRVKVAAGGQVFEPHLLATFDGNTARTVFLGSRSWIKMQIQRYDWLNFKLIALHALSSGRSLMTSHKNYFRRTLFPRSTTHRDQS